ncbi:hypothetical protein COO91_08220 [Nostoc flagelliforme CCNUN1]|uniref:Uncharacterized protein n=1 Tax=Nostoc flagelliforme CCNUN1 TaxID=2038116 RepID=A0A2K8T521_9NOSO|nr:hypothetical protein COO91_08220 [Nostoc flagelliforme CCNUN1]
MFSSFAPGTSLNSSSLNPTNPNRIPITLVKEKSQPTFKQETETGFRALFSNIMTRIISFV